MQYFTSIWLTDETRLFTQAYAICVYTSVECFKLEYVRMTDTPAESFALMAYKQSTHLVRVSRTFIMA